MSFGDGDDPWQELLHRASRLLEQQGRLPPRVFAERLHVSETIARQLLDQLSMPQGVSLSSLSARKP